MDTRVWVRVTAHGVIRYLSSEGDKRIEWTTDNWKSVELAHKVFREKIGSGHLAYKKANGANGTVAQGEVVRELTPDATDVVIVRPLQGG